MPEGLPSVDDSLDLQEVMLPLVLLLEAGQAKARQERGPGGMGSAAAGASGAAGVQGDPYGFGASLPDWVAAVLRVLAEPEPMGAEGQPGGMTAVQRQYIRLFLVRAVVHVEERAVLRRQEKHEQLRVEQQQRQQGAGSLASLPASTPAPGGVGVGTAPDAAGSTGAPQSTQPQPQPLAGFVEEGSDTVFAAFAELFFKPLVDVVTGPAAGAAEAAGEAVAEEGVSKGAEGRVEVGRRLGGWVVWFHFQL